MQKIVLNIWFDNQAEEAVRFYTSLFEDSEILRTEYYGPASAKVSGQEEGSVLTIEFTLNGQHFLALNGGPVFQLNPSLSLIVYCEDQDEVDTYWETLSEGGSKNVCGWLVDKYGLSWQIVPRVLDELLADPDPGKAERVMAAMLEMNKLDIAKLCAAASAE